MQVVPDALLLQFAAAEVHEAGGDMAAAKAVYEGLAAPLDGDRDAAAPATPDAKDAAAAAAAQVLPCPVPLLVPMNRQKHVLQHCAVRMARRPTNAALLANMPKHVLSMIPRASRTAGSRRRGRWCGCSTSASPSARRACAPPARCAA